MSDTKDYVVMVIPVDAIPYVAVWTLPKQESGRFKALKSHVEQVTGDPMEHVTVFADYSGGTEYTYLDMFVNELGHERGLEVNVLATALYHNNVRVHQPELLADAPFVVGPAVLFEERVWQ